jgi:lysophospholipase L1-like esterase
MIARHRSAAMADGEHRTGRKRRAGRAVRGALAAVLTATAAGGVATLAPGEAGAATPVVYVAMGDSYAAGPFILPETDPYTCVRSKDNYAGILSRKMPVQTFRDVTCSGATTGDFSNPQPGQVSGVAAPQYDALTPDTTLVTVGIGGNDVGLVGLAENCLNFAPPPIGKSCAAKYTAGGVDQYGQRIDAFASTYGTVIDHIRLLSPNAKILMISYPFAIRPGGCFPAQPLLGVDATYIQAKIDQLNAAMAAQAAAHGATYVDVRTMTVGHDACALPGVRWIEGLVPTSDAFPLHPNELFMKHAEKKILPIARS